MSRVSSDEQAKGYSLGVQSDALENYCLRNDIEIVYSFKEDHSAKDFKRPAFNVFLDYLKKNKGQVDLLLFTSWDRFSRNAMDAYHMIDKLGKLGIQTQSIEHNIDLSVPENKMMLAMYLVTPEVDNDRRSIKIRGGIRAANKAGRWCHLAPYGYKNSRDASNRPLIVPNHQAPDIKWAFEQVAKGSTQVAVIRELNKRGIMVRKSRFSVMLRNPIYIGKLKIPASEDEPCELVDGVHEGIVPEKVFYQIERLLNGNHSRKRITNKQRNEDLPLRGILRCTKCQGKLTGSKSRGRNGKRHAYYHCNHCRNERYRSEIANDTVKEILNGLKFSKPSQTIFKELVSRLLLGNGKKHKANIVRLETFIAKQKVRIERLQGNLADGNISSQDFTEMKARYSDLMRQAELELTSSKQDSSEKKELLKQSLNAIPRLGEFYSKADPDAKIKLLGSIFPEMIEFDGNKCRTTRINEAIALCLSIDKGLEEKKNRTFHDKLEVSGLVENTGVEPVTS